MGIESTVEGFINRFKKPSEESPLVVLNDGHVEPIQGVDPRDITPKEPKITQGIVPNLPPVNKVQTTPVDGYFSNRLAPKVDTPDDVSSRVDGFGVYRRNNVGKTE